MFIQIYLLDATATLRTDIHRLCILRRCLYLKEMSRASGDQHEEEPQRIPAHLRDNLIKLRQETGRSIAEFAASLGVAAITWRKLEAGTRALSPRLVALLALRYGVHPESLYSDCLRTLGGQPYNLHFFEAFGRMSAEDRQELVRGGQTEEMVLGEVTRLVREAQQQQKLAEWLPAFRTLLKRMARRLGVRPPIDFVSDETARREGYWNPP